MEGKIITIILLLIQYHISFGSSNSLQNFDDFYVKHNGNDTFNCGSLDSPCLTLSYTLKIGNSSLNRRIFIDGNISMGNYSVQNFESLLLSGGNYDEQTYPSQLNCGGFKMYFNLSRSFAAGNLTFGLDCGYSFQVHTRNFSLSNCQLLATQLFTLHSLHNDEDYGIHQVTLYNNIIFGSKWNGDHSGVYIRFIDKVRYHFHLELNSGNINVMGDIRNSTISILSNQIPAFVLPSFAYSSLLFSDNYITESVRINIVESSNITIVSNTVYGGITILDMVYSQLSILSNPFIHQLDVLIGRQKFSNNIFLLKSNKINHVLISGNNIKGLDIIDLKAQEVLLVVNNIENNQLMNIIDSKFYGNRTRGLFLDLKNVDLQIMNSKFDGNNDGESQFPLYANVGSSKKSGGAIYVSEVRSLIIYSCQFTNNYSQRFGGGIYLQKGNLFLTGCLFSGNKAEIEGTDLWTNAENVIIKDTTFQVTQCNGKSSITSTGFYPTKNVTIICPSTEIFHNYSHESEIQYSCSSCYSSTYTLFQGKYINDTISNPACLDCPRKAICQSNGRVRVGPDQWCQEYKGEIECLGCPVGYCNSTTHDWRDSCVGNRTGILCGDCKPGYSVSITSSRCVKNNNCRSHWMSFYLARPTINLIFLALVPLGGKTEWKTFTYVLQIYPILTTNNWLRVISSALGAQSLQFTGGSDKMDICIFPEMTMMRRLSFELISSISLIVLAFVGFGITLIVRALLRYKRTRNFTEMEYSLMDVEEKDKPQTSSMGVGTPERWCATLISGGLWVFSAVLTLTLQLFRCVEIGGERRMFLEGTSKCYEWNWVIIVIVCLIPFSIQLLRVILHSRKNSETARVSLIVLEACYRDGFKWWEVVSVSRKTLLVAAYVFLDADSQALVLFLLCQVFLFVHSAARPMGTEKGNTLETFCLAVLSLISGIELLRNESILSWSNVNQFLLDNVQACCLFSAFFACIVSSAFGYYPKVAQIVGLLWNKVGSCWNKKQDYQRDSSLQDLTADREN
eukprot:TRINITY_DN6306_c0_g1_i1.p1 TRINITY_DN6306_c0_g1~~TRINITY_DN6306_c0_g1_i1.p1  ORF type:complete len:1018 (-),score=183.69 TRINITY_DN6306_c0_g1_i1:3-3056(-)